MRKGPTLVPLAPAHLVCLGAFQAAAILAFIDIRCAAIPLALFLVLCLVAPFLPGFGFYLPIVSRGRRERRAVALTFDDGPDPATTTALLGLLSKHGVPAAFFLAGIRAAEHRDLVRDILSRGHAIGNHSYSHSPILMLKGTGSLREEVAAAQSLFGEFGIRPLAFRPPVGITNPRLWRVLLEAGMYCVNFSLRARDAGNRRIGELSRKILARAKPGDIILLHDVAPGKGFDAGLWLREIEAIIIGLRERAIDILPLSEIIRRPVMMKSAAAVTSNPAAAFYDALAGSYDGERRPSPAFAGELALFKRNYLPRISPGHRVLEIGAGTGIYTLPLARRCREITAVELSGNMTAMLQEKAARDGISNILYMNRDIADFKSEEKYDSVCSFSSFEYIQDLEPLLDQLSGCIKPGGTIYFTTANRSFFRFFVQIGNAMRQGLWLHARTAGAVRKMLASAGFTGIRVSTHVMKYAPRGGLLLEAWAVKNGG